ncbi:ParB N-terminal domain-containing protein [Hydrogenimonas sp. SS33]|uniref:ParB/RepB/Spo0J family partition protein n=1 Tax=Hydrogenimonas leucolamina TaxID=2954236 RepID=UPI00336C1848
MAKLDIQKFKKNAKSTLDRKESHGIFKEQAEKVETIPLDALETGLAIRLFETGSELLKASIAEMGQLEPIVVRRAGEKYEILDGHRRVAAARALGRADIPAEVAAVGEKEAPFMPWLLNAPESFDLIETALYLQRLEQVFGFDEETIERNIGLKLSDYRELFFDCQEGEAPLSAFNRHFEGVLKRYFRFVNGELDIEKSGVRLRLKIDEAKADDKAKAEIYRLIFRLSKL